MCFSPFTLRIRGGHCFLVEVYVVICIDQDNRMGSVIKWIFRYQNDYTSSFLLMAIDFIVCYLLPYGISGTLTHIDDLKKSTMFIKTVSYTRTTTKFHVPLTNGHSTLVLYDVIQRQANVSLDCPAIASTHRPVHLSTDALH